MRLRSLLVVATAALSLAPGARAHVEFRPPFVTGGEETELGVSTPNERKWAMVALDLVAPAGVELLGADAPAGWQSDLVGTRVAWTGGKLPAGATAVFRVRLRGGWQAGTLAFRAVQRFEDGASASWQPRLTVLPGASEDEPKQHLGRALVAAVVGVALIAFSLLGLRLVRGRPLSDR